MKEKLKIMAVMCHPADAIDGAGGTLAQHADRGDEVTMVVTTHGLDTHDWKNLDKQILGQAGEPDKQTVALGKKEQEVIDGMAMLGVKDVRFLRFSDELHMCTTELIKAIAKIMGEVRPHLLITHNPTEELGLADTGHSGSAIAALRARTLSNSPSFNSEFGGRRFPSQIYFMTMNGETTRLTNEGTRHPDVIIDISDSIERKVKAMDCLASQFYPGKLARKCMENVNGRQGLHFCLSYAEGFQMWKPHIYRHLPLNEHLHWMQSTPIGQTKENLLKVDVHDL